LLKASGVSLKVSETLYQALRPLTESLLALSIGLGFGALLIAIYRYNPLAGYSAMFLGAYGNPYSLAETISYSIPLALSSLTFSACFRAGIFNIGSEGQIYMGAIAAVAVGSLYIGPLGYIHVLLAIGSSAILGVAWSLVPALLKIYRGVHEVISTIMLNWIAYYSTIYIATNILVDPRRPEKTLSVLESARLSTIVPGTTLTQGVFISIAIVLLYHLIFSRTVIGYELSLMGSGLDVARYAGVDIRKITIYSFILGGIASGIAGGLLVIAKPPTYAIYGDLGNISGYGFEGIGVALIGRNNPLGILAASILYGGIKNGGRYMEYQAGIDSDLVRAINGLFVIALSVPELLRIIRRLVRR
jgi:simple sugar transport system permease protein